MSQIESAPSTLQNELSQSMRHYSPTLFPEYGIDSLIETHPINRRSRLNVSSSTPYKSTFQIECILINATKINLHKARGTIHPLHFLNMENILEESVNL